MYATDVYTRKPLEEFFYVHILRNNARIGLFIEMCTSNQPSNTVFLYTRDAYIAKTHVADGVIDYDSDLDRNEFQHQATLSIEKSILNETLAIMASGALDLWDFSSASELELDYKLTDAITLSLIGDLYLEGPDGKEGLYGEYRDFSSVTFKGKMSF